MNEKFSHYSIVGHLGVGGMGEVYRARDTILGRDVALKILPEEFAADPERLARFQREAKLLASLNHPNIAAIHSLAQEGDRIGLALELVEGEDLSVHLGRGALPIDRALEVAAQIAAALEAAHEQGVIHRDLKPANVKLAPDGKVKVLDFGLAKATDPGAEAGSSLSTTISPSMATANTRDGIILGTAAYMSPEQARGAALDRRTDIFSFGIVLYEMLAGVRPFQGQTMSDILASILKEQPNAKALPPRTPPAIRLLVSRCLEKDAKRRLRDIGEARLIIEAVRDGDASASVILGSAAASGQSRKIGRREIAAWALAGLAVAAVGLALLRGRTADAPAAVSYKLSVPIDGESDLRYTQGGLAISPDGTRIAYVNQRQLHVRRLDSWEPITVAGAEGASSPFWSPDGQWLVFGVGHDLWKVRPDGTQRTLVGSSDTVLSGTTGGAWLADDRIVFRARADLMSVPAGGGNPVTFVSSADTAIVDFHEPDALPGGKGLLVGVHRQAGVNTLAVVGLDGVLKVVLMLPGSELGNPCYSPSGHILYTNKGDIWAVPFDLARQEVTGAPFIVARNATLPGFSADGTLVYMRNAGLVKRQFVLVDRAGTIVERLGPPDDLASAYALSPDGRRAAGSNSSQSDLYLYDTRESRIRATFTDLEHDMVSFTPDGASVLFSTGTEDNYRIGRKALDRNDQEDVLVPSGDHRPHFFGACPVVNKEGTRLFYTSIGANGKQDVSWLDLTQDAVPQPFLTRETAEYAARPSPADERYVAYVSEESGVPQVFLTTWPDAGEKWQISVAGGLWPRWNGDGSEITFAVNNEIYAAAVSYSPLRIDRPRKLFDRPEHDDRQPFGWPATFDVTADGERFLVTELALDTNLVPFIAVVPDWSAGEH